MTLKRCRSLIHKIDGYIKDKKAAGEELPYGTMGMKADAILNYCLYGTSFSEYFAYRFYALNRKEKKNYMTRRYMFPFFDKYNPTVLRNRIGDKRETKLYYGKLLHREQFEYNKGFEAFCEFAKKHKHLFVKKAVSWGGMGAYVADVSTKEKQVDAWSKLNNECVIEEYLINCDEIRKIYPGSLNTIKVLTLWVKHRPVIQTALFRMGNNTNVDNVHLGGICALVDIETGIVVTKAVDKHFKEYVLHPITNEQIVGFKIPYWEEAKELALTAASITPDMRYSSWDIAITNDGPVLIEGNWDAEFYAEQMLLARGVRKKYCNQLDL